jgi:hypothetical protein
MVAKCNLGFRVVLSNTLASGASLCVSVTKWKTLGGEETPAQMFRYLSSSVPFGVVCTYLYGPHLSACRRQGTEWGSTRSYPGIARDPDSFVI